MAVQLERFLKRQLRNPELSDREFIESTLAETLAYKKRMGGHKQQMVSQLIEAESMSIFEV